ncbi:hypothetical protein KAR48_14180 [bacterium]|nr:hypothetical protein [bacterium]
MKRINQLLIVVCAAVILLAGTVIAEEPYKAFHKYLVELKGWDAEDPTGMNMNMPGMSMLTAARSYEKDDKTIMATVMIGGAAAMAMQSGDISMEADGVSMKTETIDGFRVMRGYDTEEKSGMVSVRLGNTEEKTAIFMVVFEGVAKKDFLNLAKKFDWKAIAKAAKKRL